jgi:hypothetical protein
MAPKITLRIRIGGTLYNCSGDRQTGVLWHLRKHLLQHVGEDVEYTEQDDLDYEESKRIHTEALAAERADRERAIKRQFPDFETKRPAPSSGDEAEPETPKPPRPRRRKPDPE